MNQTVLIDSIFDVNSRPIQAPRCLLLVGLGVLLLALSSRVAFYLPFTPVPVTAQTFTVLLIGLTYGRRLAVSTIMSYIILGSLGLPVFANAAPGLLLLSPSGGYIIGFFFATLLCASFAELGWTKSFLRLSLTIFLAQIIIYTCGVIQLSLFFKGNLFALGVEPFLFGEIAKSVLAILALPIVWKLMNKNKK